MTDLQHPVTGEHVRASSATAEKLLEQGWRPQGGPGSDETPAAAPKEKKPAAAAKKGDDGKQAGDDDGTGEGGEDGNPSPPAEIPAPDKPLGEMKLTELIEYAEKIGFDADSIAALKKAGMSKAKAIAAIDAHVEAQQS